MSSDKIVAYASSEYTTVVGSQKTNTEIFSLLSKTAEGIAAIDLLDSAHTAPFALYEPLDNPLYDDHQHCIAYGYGIDDHLHRIPKTLHMTVAEQKFCGEIIEKRIILKPVSEVHLGRDSYIPNTNTFHTEHSGIELLQAYIAMTGARIVLASKSIWDQNGGIGPMEALQYSNAFEHNTQTRASYMHVPIMDLHISELLSDTQGIIKTYQAFIAEKKHAVTKKNIGPLEDFWYSAGDIPA